MGARVLNDQLDCRVKEMTSRIRKAVRLSVWTGVVFVMALVGTYACLLAINWEDQPASEQVQEYYQVVESSPGIKESENAFLYLIGIRAQPPAKPLETGIQLAHVVRQDWADAAAGAVGSFFDPAELIDQSWKEARIDWRETERRQALAAACGFQSPESQGENGLSCSEKLRAPASALVSVQKKNRWLLERYAELLNFGSWHRVRAPHAVPVPDYDARVGGAARIGQTLYLSGAIRSTAEGGIETMKQRFERDARFWRKVLSSGENLFWRLIAERRLKRNLLMLNQGLQSLEPGRVSEALPEIWRKPLDSRERSIGRALAGELRTARLMVELEVEKKRSWWMRTFVHPFFQIQHTENAVAQLHDRQARVSRRSWKELGDWLGRREGVPVDGLFEPHPMASLYNPMGRYYLSRSHLNTSVRQYIASPAELEAARVALLTAAQARARRLGLDELRVFLREEAPRNPLSGDAQTLVSGKPVLRVEVPGGFEDTWGLSGLRFPVGTH